MNGNTHRQTTSTERPKKTAALCPPIPTDTPCLCSKCQDRPAQIAPTGMAYADLNTKLPICQSCWFKMLAADLREMRALLMLHRLADKTGEKKTEHDAIQNRIDENLTLIRRARAAVRNSKRLAMKAC